MAAVTPNDTAEAGDDRRRLVSALAEVADGSEAALADVYARTSAKLYGICLRILTDRQEAEDALQDIYVTIWQRAGAFDETRASPVTWLATIARNRAIDRLRARGNRRFTGLDEAEQVRDPGPGPYASLEIREAHDRLAACVDTLEERHAGAIRQAFFEGVTYAELATKDGVPLGTMKSWVRRALLKLRACLGE